MWRLNGGLTSGASRSRLKCMVSLLLDFSKDDVKQAGGMGLISGRKAFQRPRKEGIQLLNLIQEVYLDKHITVA